MVGAAPPDSTTHTQGRNPLPFTSQGTLTPPLHEGITYNTPRSLPHAGNDTRKSYTNAHTHTPNSRSRVTHTVVSPSPELSPEAQQPAANNGGPISSKSGAQTPHYPGTRKNTLSRPYPLGHEPENHLT